jgi:hypothetical protein
MVENDWRVNQDGEDYKRGLSPSGAPDLQTRLEQLHRPSTERAYGEAYQQHAPDEYAEHEALRQREAIGGGTGGGSGANGRVTAKKHVPAEVRMVENNWKENPDGKEYTQRLGETGRPGVQARLEQLHRPSTERSYGDAYQQHAPDALREHETLRGGRETGGGSGEPGGVAAAGNGQD